MYIWSCRRNPSLDMEHATGLLFASESELDAAFLSILYNAMFMALCEEAIEEATRNALSCIEDDQSAHSTDVGEEEEDE